MNNYKYLEECKGYIYDLVDKMENVEVEWVPKRDALRNLAGIIVKGDVEVKESFIEGKRKQLGLFPEDTKIIKNDRALIILNRRLNKKVIVRRNESDADDLEKAVAIALLKWQGFNYLSLKRIIEKVEIQ